MSAVPFAACIACINKMKQTNLERYGVECVMNTPENLIKQKESTAGQVLQGRQ